VNSLHDLSILSTGTPYPDQGSKSEAKTQRLGRLRLEYFQSAKAREAKAGENFVGQG